MCLITWQSDPLGAETARLTGKFPDYHLSALVKFYPTFCGIASQHIFKQNLAILKHTNGFERQCSSSYNCDLIDSDPIEACGA